MIRTCLPLVLLWVCSIVAKPIDNGLKHKSPEVGCKENSIDIVFTTKNPFEGRVYVVGHHNNDNCLFEAITQEQKRTTASLTIDLSTDKNNCGVTRQRSVNPRGLFVNTKVMISFHHSFVTKVDKGFEISCFFMEVDKALTYPLTVSMPGELTDFTVQAEMPQCRYEVEDIGAGVPATVVKVGAPLKHKWTCVSTSPDLWCMTVKSCNVQDGLGTEVVVIDENGCAKDEFLLGNLEYAADSNLMAMKEAHAFKYADNVIVNFACSIQLRVRGEDENGNKLDCPRPQCTLPASSRRRLRRRAPIENVLPFGEVDVRAQQLDVLEPQADFGVSTDNPNFVAAVEQTAEFMRHGQQQERSLTWFGARLRHGGDCVPRSAFAGALLTALLSTAIALVVSVVSLRRRTDKQLDC